LVTAAAVLAALLTATPATAAAETTAATGTSTAAVASPAAIGSDGNPTADRAPSGAFTDACQDVTTAPAAQQRCQAAALRDFDAARAAEGLGPMSLPTGFASLPAAQQLLAAIDIERVDRNLPPVTGLSAPLNTLAQAGAQGWQDPDLPDSYNGSGGATWAGGTTSVLLAVYWWLYYDGPASNNIDCTSPGDGGCWGHRDTLLGTWPDPLVGGGGFSTTAGPGTGSITFELYGGEPAYTPVAPLWTDLVATVPVATDPDTVTLTAAAGTPARTTLTIGASGQAGAITATISAGAGQWSVTPAHCTLPAGGSCPVTLTFTAPRSGVYPGTLTVTGPNGPRNVPLTGTVTGPPAAPGTPRVSAGPGRATLTWTQPSTPAAAAVTGYAVQVSLDNGATWTPAAPAARTRTARSVTVTGLINGHPYRFRVAALSAAGDSSYSPASPAVVPAAAAAVTLARTTIITAGHRAAVTGKITDAASRARLAGQRVQLLAHPAGTRRWTVATTVTSGRTGLLHALVRPRENTAYRWRSVATSSHSSGLSTARTVAVRYAVSAAAKPRNARPRQTIRLYGMLAPAPRGHRVTLQMYTHHRWVNVTATRTRVRLLPNHTRRCGYVFSLRFVYRGTFRLRAAAARSARNHAGVSRTVTVHVR